jgi:hypothetical protein
LSLFEHCTHRNTSYVGDIARSYIYAQIHTAFVKDPGLA